MSELALKTSESQREVVLPPDLLTNWQSLRARAVDTAESDPEIPNYVVLKWVNKKGHIDSAAETQAAEVIAHVFRNAFPTHILAIQRSGISLGRAIHQNFPQAKFVEAVKYETQPDEKEDRWVVQAYSYSQQRYMWFQVPHISPGVRVLVIDDVCARSSVAWAVMTPIRANVVGFGVYFDKQMQRGLEKIAGEFGIPSFSVIRIKNIQDGGITLMNENEALKVL